MSKAPKEQPSRKGKNGIARVAIYPGIGVARVGNSPDEFFVGPESPWEDPNPTQKFKDPQGRVKRQAARFRLYAFDHNGDVVKELTVADCEINWTVEMANKKAAYYKFNGRYHKDYTPSNLRNNKDGKDNRNPDERKELIIAPGPKSISGASREKVVLNGGKISSYQVKTSVTLDVPLGELLTDDKGRLLVLGGFGKSDSLIYDNPITEYANNDNWYDDTSDGSVNATVTFPDGSVMKADEAWVLVAPPKFAPNHYNIVSLYDMITETTVPQAARATEFYRDIYPILYRTSNYAWISGMAYNGHRAGKGGDFINPVAIQVLTCKEKSIEVGGKVYNCAQERLNIANRLRKHIVPEVEWNADHTKIVATKVPNEAQANKEANLRFMPQLSGDDGDAVSFPVPPDYNYNLFKQIPSLTWLTLLPSQQKHMENWANGEFTVDQPEVFVPLENYPLNVQPAMLDRGVLEPCIGGPFFPGIEITFIANEKETFRAPYRINSRLYKPGDITRIMALPWQADFFECNTHWWPGQRPDDVVSESEYEQAKIQLTNYKYDNANVANPDGDKNIPDPANSAEVYSSYALAMANRLQWARGIAAPDDSPNGDNIMVKYWHELGFVTKRVAPPVYNNGKPFLETVYVEQERHVNAGLIAERDLFYMIQNIEKFPQILPKVKAYVDGILKNAIDYGHSDDTPEQMKFFPYSPEYFEARMMDAYNSFVTDEADYDPATDPTFPDRNSVITRIKQFAPLNLTDGAWLRHIDKAGPTDEVQSLLFSIYQDERGNGDPSLNHCNIYQDLCHSVGYYPPPVDSREFASDTSLLDSAFTTPTFELAISQFTDSYYPEILGMTLFLEWSVIELKPTIKLLEYYGLNPHFYVMHVGIDNAVNGHGRRAIDAVNLYLDNIRQMGGEEAVQQQFKRIWSGYIAFSFAGTFGQDLSNLISQPVPLSQQMQNMITSKAKYGRLNHDQHMLGANKINDWFDDPDGFMQALVDSGYIVPGNIQGSKFFSLLEFQSGPMFRVFTDAEIQLWKDWTLWLANKTPAPVPAVSSFDAMKTLIKTLSLQQSNNPDHMAISIKEADADISHSIAEWFTLQPVKFMAALSAEKNKLIVKYEPDNSMFITQLLSGANSMGQAFNYVIPNAGGMTGRQIAIKWISEGCPLTATEPPLRKDQVMKYSRESLWLTSSALKKRVLKVRKIVGMGSVH